MNIEKTGYLPPSEEVEIRKEWKCSVSGLVCKLSSEAEKKNMNFSDSGFPLSDNGKKDCFSNTIKKPYKSKVFIVAWRVDAKLKNISGLLVYFIWVQWLKSLRLQTRVVVITWVDGRVSDNISNNLLNLWSQACSLHIDWVASFHRLG